jgi:Ca2+-binding EF-hand superfamily protein
MFSFNSAQRLRDTLSEIGKQEKQLEVLRQILCEQPEFEPYAAFRRIDRMRRGFITNIDIMEFLAQNNFKHAESECNYFIEHYDRDRDGHLIYAEFLPSMLPLDNPELRTIATQRKVYDVAYDEYLVYDVEYALARLISREIVSYIELDDLKIELANQYDFSFLDAFASIDVYETKFIDFTSLRNFFRAQGKLAKDDDIVCILRRIDRDDDGRITYEDFVEAVRPQKPTMKKDKGRLSHGSGFRQSARSPTNRMKSPPKEMYESFAQRNASPRMKSPIKTTYVSPVRECCVKSKLSPKSKFDLASPSLTKEKFRGSTLSKKTADTETLSRSRDLNASLGFTRTKTGSPTKRKSLATRSSLREIDGNHELVKVFREIINLEREVELAKQDLALRADYNVFDTFRLFDKKGKGSVSVSEIEEGFNDLGIFPNKEDLYLFIRRFDRDGDGRLRFTDFSDAFNPIQQEYYKLIKGRTPVNGDLFFDSKQLFSQQTRRLLKGLLTTHLENEAVIEALRQKLSRNPGFNVRESFENLDSDADGYITLYEIRVAMDNYDVYATEKEIFYLINRFDKNDDNKVSYAEYLQEIGAKSHKKY